MTTEQHIAEINILAEDLAWQSSIAIKNELHIPFFDAAAEACALAISEYLQAQQDQRDAEMERMVERGQDAAQEARGRSGKFHYDEEMPLKEAFEG
jgi:hypothetical protein